MTVMFILYICSLLCYQKKILKQTNIRGNHGMYLDVIHYVIHDILTIPSGILVVA